ncbi:MAG TPA: hypothetical protein VGN12_20050 [Pirellulales bacterium]|jgi:hypothetical protein
MLAIYLLTGPQANRAGLFRVSVGMAAEDVNADLQTLPKRLREVCESFDWRWDDVNRVIYIPSWWRWNPPENPKVLIGMLSDLAEVPTGPLLTEFSENLRYLPPNLHETFQQTLGKRFGTVSDSKNKNMNKNNIPPSKKTAVRTNAQKNPAVDYVEGAVGGLSR